VRDGILAGRGHGSLPAERKGGKRSSADEAGDCGRAFKIEAGQMGDEGFVFRRMRMRGVWR
jgi:hypothetical protein